MRAGRLVHLLRLLQTRGQMTAGALAAELEVTVRTVLRDIDALGSAGVAVYSMRGPRGGFALRSGPHNPPVPFDPPVPAGWGRSGPRSGQRGVVALSPLGHQLSVLCGRPSGLRIRRNPKAQAAGGWLEASFPLTTLESALSDVLALGANVEVLQPRALRTLLSDTGRLIAERNA